ncbi:MAG: hypothetical protein KA099_03895 [Alphaproteobacteria bacterium]|nr:hypothetical protein [Alphaproteobacteria bacterium]MBP7759642.1 hypothetical protein [Alphaproteobacteria bacterium]MBP7762992.1 hypothetical protein [Alphaproteobacteria bacterium]MBP7904449.1 hypothetical protein [Alphaproteobacteria bacterium]
MPKVLCTCKQTIPLHAIPNAYEWHMIQDKHFISFFGEDDDAKDQTTKTEIADQLMPEMTPSLLCPSCGRLLVYWKGWNDMPIVYKPEEEILDKIKKFMNFRKK